MLLFFEWEPAVDISVCCLNLCMCFSPSLCGKNLTSIPYQQTTQHFLFSPPSSSLCFVYSPWSSPTPSFLSSLPQTHSDLAAICVPASYCRVYHPSICLYSLQRVLVLFGEAKENSNVEGTPHQATQMDHRAFTWTKGMPHIENVRGIQLHKTECYENIVFCLFWILHPGWIIHKYKEQTNTYFRVVQRGAKVSLVWGRFRLVGVEIVWKINLTRQNLCSSSSTSPPLVRYQN